MPFRRFAASHFASAITEAGHMILTRTRDRLEALGYRVLCGDTDSVFVASGLPADASLDVALEKGIALCAEVNAELKVYIESTFGVESALELEFEKYYRRFLLPPARGASGRGRAKGYAGLRQDASGARLEIIGMEAVRRDWTRLAHQLQRELLTRIFNDEPAALLEACVADWVEAVRQGRKDTDLVYHKGLRKSVESYTRSSPPHVKAARLLARPSGVIHYIMTHEGPQPVEHLSAAIDYRHYIDKQVAPIVGTLAAVCDLDLDVALRGAPSLFSGTGIKF
jgi:DNA polymerase-2